MMLSNVLPNSEHLKLLFILFLISASIGCSTTQPRVPVENRESTWASRQGELSAIKYWRLSGRLSVSQGDEAWNLSLEWQQKDEDYQISIYGPFGAGKVRLTGNAHGVMLKNADDESYYADHPEELLYQQTGVLMPIEGLRYWVMGLASPQQIIKPKIDPLGRLAFLEESNWKVDFKRYMQVSGMDLPRKVFIVKSAEEIDVRLVVDKWTLGAF